MVLVRKGTCHCHLPYILFRNLMATFMCTSKTAFNKSKLINKMGTRLPFVFSSFLLLLFMDIIFFADIYIHLMIDKVWDMFGSWSRQFTEANRRLTTGSVRNFFIFNIFLLIIIYINLFSHKFLVYNFLLRNLSVINCFHMFVN